MDPPVNDLRELEVAAEFALVESVCRIRDQGLDTMEGTMVEVVAGMKAQGYPDEQIGRCLEFIAWAWRCL